MPLDNEVAWKEIGRVPSKGNGISIIRFTEMLNGWMGISTTILPDASAESVCCHSRKNCKVRKLCGVTSAEVQERKTIIAKKEFPRSTGSDASKPVCFHSNRCFLNT